MDLRAAIIGLGNISGAHIQGWKSAEGVQPVAGADVNEQTVERAGTEHDLEGYTDWREMLDDQKPDLVSICTPPFLHREMAVECLGRGVHVMCEKPMAGTVEDAEVMALAAADASALLMIAYCHRFHGPAMKMKEVLDTGVLGTPLFFRGTFPGGKDMSSNHRGVLAQAGGGALMDNGSHALDLYQYLMGPIANVSCRAGTRVQSIETDDVAVVLFEGANGCYGEVLVGYALPPGFGEWRFAGSEGIVQLDDYMSGPVRSWSRETDQWTEYECDNSQSRFERQFAHFIECIREGKQPRSNAETALHTQRVVGAAYEDARLKGVPVEV